MTQTAKRIRQMQDLIQHELAYALKKEVQDPRLRNLSITSVSVSPDLRNAKVYFIPPENTDIKAIQTALDKANGFFRCVLAQKTETRYVPKISFSHDKSLEYGMKMSELIDKTLMPDAEHDKAD